MSYSARYDVSGTNRDILAGLDGDSRVAARAGLLSDGSEDLRGGDG